MKLDKSDRARNRKNELEKWVASATMASATEVQKLLKKILSVD